MHEQIHDTYDFGAEVVYPPVKPKSPPRRMISKVFRFVKAMPKPIAICIAMAGVITMCVAAPAIPAIAISFTTVVYAIALLVTALYGRGWVRPYSIVALISIAAFAIVCVEEFPFHGPEELLIVLIFLHIVASGAGLTAAIVHGFLKRNAGLIPVPKIPFLNKWLSND